MESVPFPGVGAVIDAVIYASESEGCPQGSKTTEEATTGEVAGWQRGDGERSDLHLLHPVEFRASALIGAKAFQNGAYTQSGDPARPPQGLHLSQTFHGARSQMIVVIVGNKNGVYGRQIVQRERWREEAFWTGPLGWTRALVPNRINEDAHAINFNQGGGVTEPGNAQAGLWTSCINSWIGVKW